MTFDENKTDELSDEQFCELLMGRAISGDADANALKDAVAVYRTETLQWAERRSAAMPSLVPLTKRGGFWAAVPQWSLAAVAVMTVAIGVAHFRNASEQTAAVDAPAAVIRTVDAEAASPQQIADDNALLGSIDAAVHADAGLPVIALGLDSSHAASRAHGSME